MKTRQAGEVKLISYAHMESPDGPRFQQLTSDPLPKWADNIREGGDMKSGIELITEERKRQVEVEGWTPEHDDEHEYGALAKAAACYAVHHTDARVVESFGSDEDAWPWSSEWDKRNNDEIRCLTKAGALIAAEIDRIQREKPSFG